MKLLNQLKVILKLISVKGEEIYSNSLKTNKAQIKKVNLSDMEDFCENCGACIKNCLGGAIYEEPIEQSKGPGIVTHIDRSKYMESLLNNNYCSYCLKICPQGHK